MKDVNLIFFLTSIGHFNNDEIYKFTLNSLRKQIGLEKFNKKIVSLKLFQNNISKASDILKDFKDFDYQFIWNNPDKNITKDSSYGKKHAYYLLTNYLHDIAASYLELERRGDYSKYTYLVEDDSPTIILKDNLESYIDKAISKLEKDNDLFSVNFMREGNLKEDTNYLSRDYDNDGTFLLEKFDNYNFQNQIFRTDEMIKVAHKIRDNYGDLFKIHTESAVREGINMINKNYKITYFLPRNAHSVHIGTSDYEKWVKSYGL